VDGPLDDVVCVRPVRRERGASAWRGAGFEVSRGVSVLGKAHGLGWCAGLGRRGCADAEGDRRGRSMPRRGARSGPTTFQLRLL
jgi:hypothetical protein